MPDQVEIRSSMTADEVATTLASGLGDPEFNGWPRRPLVGSVHGREFTIMKRYRSRRHNDYFACTGAVVDLPAGSKISAVFRWSTSAKFFKYVFMPMAGFLFAAGMVAAGTSALSGSFNPGTLLSPVMSMVMLLVGWAVCAGARSSNSAERDEILRYLHRASASSS